MLSAGGHAWKAIFNNAVRPMQRLSAKIHRGAAREELRTSHIRIAADSGISTAKSPKSLNAMSQAVISPIHSRPAPAPMIVSRSGVDRFLRRPVQESGRRLPKAMIRPYPRRM
jgi:hypothetical protein